MRKEIMEIKKNMLRAGKLTWKQVSDICKLEEQFADECEEIAAQCEAEGYPSHGSNYEIRCVHARQYYDEQIALIEKQEGMIQCTDYQNLIQSALNPEN